MDLDLKNKIKLKSLENELANATRLIEQSGIPDITSSEANFVSLSSNVHETESLLARCAKIVHTESEDNKPSLRLVHHFACSGGSLISKCISSMPNVFLLTEMHPLSLNHLGTKPKYLPTDLTSLARYGRFPSVDELAIKIFKNNIVDTESFLRERGGILVLREHTHIDFCLNDKASDESKVLTCLSPFFNIKNLITIRNPIDSYTSLVKNGWVQFTPATFDEYCKRLLKFTSLYPKENIILYEDFVNNPEAEMEKMCEILDLPYDSSFIDIFDVIKVTGDSGRSGSKIKPRERQPLSEDFVTEVNGSESFRRICSLFNY